jgi:hypothetical protein
LEGGCSLKKPTDLKMLAEIHSGKAFFSPSKKPEKFGTENEYKKYSVLISLNMQVLRKWLRMRSKPFFFIVKTRITSF